MKVNLFSADDNVKRKKVIGIDFYKSAELRLVLSSIKVSYEIAVVRMADIINEQDPNAPLLLK